jgi:hypothetical protein
MISGSAAMAIWPVLQESGYGVLGLPAPQRPLDRGALFFAAVATAAPDVADRGQRGLGDLALATVDEFQADGSGQVRVALLDSNESHDVLLA